MVMKTYVQVWEKSVMSNVQRRIEKLSDFDELQVRVQRRSHEEDQGTQG